MRSSAGSGSGAGASAMSAGQEPPLRLVEVDVRDLPPRVHARVRSARDDEPRRLALPAEDRRERVLELALHRPAGRLARPAGELRSVVCEVEPDADHQYSSWCV